MTQNCLANALRAQAEANEGAERALLLGEAVKAYRLAQEVYTRAALPQDWATTQNNLANALSDQAAASEGAERARLSGEAVQACRNSIQVFGPEGRQTFLAQLLGQYSYYVLFGPKPVEAIAAAEEALALAPSLLWIATNQAHGYLLTGQFEKAAAIYRKHAAEKLNEKMTFAQSVLEDFAELRKAGIDHPDMAKIEAMLKATVSPVSQPAAKP